MSPLVTVSHFNTKKDLYMLISFDIINGISLGFEFIPQFEDLPNHIILDILLIRIMIEW